MAMIYNLCAAPSWQYAMEYDLRDEFVLTDEVFAEQILEPSLRAARFMMDIGRFPMTLFLEYWISRDNSNNK
jgi:hypothetical protein